MKKIAVAAFVFLIPLAAYGQQGPVISTPTEQVLANEVNQSTTRALQAEIQVVTLQRENADLKQKLAEAEKKPTPVASAEPTKPAEPQKK